jgi:PKD repeat protein
MHPDFRVLRARQNHRHVRAVAMVRRVAAAAAGIGLLSCTDTPVEAPKPSPEMVTARLSAATDPNAIIMIGAGNIARCDQQNDEKTALLLDANPGLVFTTGDNVNGGTLTDFQNCYAPTWGRHLANTRPAAGDLDYLNTSGTNPNAAGYFSFFGAAAGDPAKGYYSYDVGTNWHIIVLNTGVAMGATSEQVAWLTADLAATTRPCVLAYWHFPRFSSFSTQVRTEIKPFWDVLHAAKADVVVNGHYRLYERFAPQSPTGVADPLGVRQFTVGTGGQGLDAASGIPTPRVNSEKIITNTFGVLKLSLSEYTYAWEFIPVAGSSATDAGEAACSGAPNQAPRADAGGPYVTEGLVAFDGSRSSDIDHNDPLTYAWSFSDGSTAEGATPTKTFATDGEYSVTLVVTDALGLASEPATATISVHNVAPTVSAGPDGTVFLPATFSVNATFNDAGGAGDGPWNWTIAWGDGQVSSGSAATMDDAISGTHQYAAFGQYAVRVSVSDRDGALAYDDVVATVRDPSSVSVLLAAGDISMCSNDFDEYTARILDTLPGIVAPLGDNVYQDGNDVEFATCYEPTWGRHKSRTKPTPGNHEYDGVPGAAGYYRYFGAAAGDPVKGYYSYNHGEWLVVVLNSASGSANRSASSPQVQWLRSILAATDRECVVAYMHHPQFTSTDGRYSGQWNVIDLWNALYENGVELVLASHDHMYERFKPMRPDGTLDPLYGIRQFTVGTGGADLYNLAAPHPNSDGRTNQSNGVLKLSLTGGSYTWEFVPVVPGAYTDRGTGFCHGRPGSNTAPVANAGGPYAGDQTVQLNGSASTDPDANVPLTYAWDFGDGTTGTGVSPTKTYANAGTYTAMLTVTDALGLASVPAAATVTIANVAPSVNAGADGALGAGSAFTLGGSFTDPAGDADAPYAWTIAWGDGQTSSGTAAATGAVGASHVYAAAGQFTARLTVTDKDGGSGSDDVSVSVSASNAAPVARPGGPYTADQTVSFNGSASSDPDGNTPLTYLWNFGDGTTGTGVSPTKTYATAGTRTVTLTVTDALGLPSTPATTTVTIANVAPTVNAGPDRSVQRGASLTLSGSFTDPGAAADAPYAWTIAWGDGTTSTANVSQPGAVSASHVYGSSGTFTARLTVRDKDGGTAFDEAVVTVSGFTLVGAGNVGSCTSTNDDKTATLLDGIAGTVFTAGDNVFSGSSAADFTYCYGPSWGRHKARTRPSAGEEEYKVSGASTYFNYFGASAGASGKGYYSYDIGTWHIVVLNSNISMENSSAQTKWLKADLSATTKACILAYWHAPRFSSHSASVRADVKPLWDALSAAGADVVINSHYKSYERFAPQTTGGTASASGIRQFVVGTGGQGTQAFGSPRANSQARSPSGTYGVLKLDLDASSYTWRFVPVAGQTYTDTGTTNCH